MSFNIFELNEGLAIAWRAIRANKIRAALTMLGIFIGSYCCRVNVNCYQGN